MELAYVNRFFSFYPVQVLFCKIGPEANKKIKASTPIGKRNFTHKGLKNNLPAPKYRGIGKKFLNTMFQVDFS